MYYSYNFVVSILFSISVRAQASSSSSRVVGRGLCIRSLHEYGFRSFSSCGEPSRGPWEEFYLGRPILIEKHLFLVICCTPVDVRTFALTSRVASAAMCIVQCSFRDVLAPTFLQVVSAAWGSKPMFHIGWGKEGGRRFLFRL